MNPSLTRDAAGSSERAYHSREGNQAEGEGAAAWQPFAELWQGPLGGRTACYTVGEDLPAEFQDDECIEDAETSRDHGEKTLARSLESYERRPITARRMLSSPPWRMATIRPAATIDAMM